MGWFDKHKPEEKKSAEEQSKAEMDALVERFSAAVDERVKPLRETVEKLQTDWDTLKTEATKTPPEDKTPRNADGTPRELTEEEKRNNASAATIALAVQTNARLTEREVLDTVHPSWAYLLPKIREHFVNTPIQRKALPDYPEYCRNVVSMVIGQEASKAGVRTNDQGKTFFLEDKSAGGGHEEGGPLSDPSLTWRQETANGTRVWTPEEQLAKLGIDPSKFAESVKKGVV